MRHTKINVILILAALTLFSFFFQRTSKQNPKPSCTVIELGGPTTFEDYYTVGDPKLFIGISAKNVLELLNSTAFNRQGGSAYYNSEERILVSVGRKGEIEQIRGPRLYFQGVLNAKEGDDSAEFESFFRPEFVDIKAGQRIAIRKFRKSVFRVTSKDGKIEFFELEALSSADKKR